MPQTNEFYFNSADGSSKIYAKEWIPENGQPKAILQISHGIAEHIQRYDDFACFMTENGFLVVGNDHLGHGKTAVKSEECGFFANEQGWSKVVEDMHSLYSIEHEKHPDLPYFILGHSMGSFLTRTYIINYKNELNGVIISGTGQNPRLVVKAGRIFVCIEAKKIGIKGRAVMAEKLAFGPYNKKFKPVRTDYDWLTRKEDIVDNYVNDSFCGFVPSAGMFKDMFDGLLYISDKKNLAKMQKDLPVLFISGNKDPVGSSGKGVEKVCNSFLKSGCKDVSKKLYDNARHEMLNEVNRAEVYADVMAWLNSKLPQ